MKGVRKAVIPAAGLGTRFLPATKSMPKEMLPLIDRPVIQYVVEEAIDSGIDDLIIITGRGKRAIEDYFDESPELEMHLWEHGKFEELKTVQEISSLIDIHYIRQKEPRGLGDAILRAEKHIGDEPFAVLLGDDIIRNQTPCTKQLIDLYREKQRSIIAVEAVSREKISSYGIIRGTKVSPSLYRIDDIVEKPRVEEAPSNIGAIGRYVFTPRSSNAWSTRPWASAARSASPTGYGSSSSSRRSTLMCSRGSGTIPGTKRGISRRSSISR
ncbi:MAG: UTP--glucose-1-phosphate uridylyltransferase [Candidatus Methanoculleus thermohydrogenotrophicum]|nr:UTP--glucose-1-phosphate uridylyltransferase [Candidatus Methanoculleus thermohydrogenotrophicum]